MSGNAPFWDVLSRGAALSHGDRGLRGDGFSGRFLRCKRDRCAVTQGPRSGASRNRLGAVRTLLRRRNGNAGQRSNGLAPKRSPAHQRGVPATRATAAVDRTTVPDQVRKSLEAGRPAIEALRKLVDTVDGTLPITARGRPGGRRSSTPRWRWPTGWSIRSTISSARSSTALRRRWAAATGKARVGNRARMSEEPPERVPRCPQSWLRVEGTRNAAHGEPRG